jgi:hypothetical protein
MGALPNRYKSMAVTDNISANLHFAAAKRQDAPILKMSTPCFPGITSTDRWNP